MNDMVVTPQMALTAETASSAVATQAKAMVEARYIMAIKRPRDLDTVRERMLKDCRRPSFAAVARYVKPIGSDQKKWPTGPSIRFAEMAVRNMGNITIETMTVYDDREKRILRVTVTDLEANVPYAQDVTIIKTIERRKAKDGDTVIGTRKNSYGDTLYILEATDDDIQNKQQALVSKCVRTLGLRLVPGDIIDECMDIVVQTQKKEDAKDPDAAKRTLFDSFLNQGVKVEQLKEYLGHSAESLNPKEIADLRALYAALRDGETTWRDIMDAKAPPKEGDPTTKQPWTNDDFEKALPNWMKLVDKKKKTPAEIIATAETKAPLTAEQKKRINALDVAPSAAVATPEQIAEIREKATAAAVNESDILKEFGLASIDQTPAVIVDDVLKYIANPIGE